MFAGADPAPLDTCSTLLAPVLGPFALGVVLGGEGTDGALGLTHIREAGGLAAVQEPHTTLADARPLHALAAGPVDLTLPAAALPGRLAAYGLELTTARQEAGGRTPDQWAQEQMNLVHAHVLRHVNYGLNVYDPSLC